MRTLVTGAAGFLGVALARRLTAQGATVRALIRQHRSAELAALSGVEILEGDVTQPGSLTAAVQDVDVVFHLAGLRRATRPQDFMAVNAEGTRNLCEAMKTEAARRPSDRLRLVFCGSQSASGPSSPERPRREEDPFQPAEWYGESKAEGERIALSYQGPLDVTVIRPSRILGPGDVENLAFFRLVARGWLVTVGGGPRPLTLVDVEDVVTLMLILAEHPLAKGEAFFVGGPTGTLEEMQTLAAQSISRTLRPLRIPPWLLLTLGSTADFFAPLVRRLIHRNLPLNRKLARQLLAPAWTCSGEKAARLLGFHTRKSLSQSVAESVQWYVQQGLL